MIFFAIDRVVLSRLSSTTAVEAFRDLLFAAAHRFGVPATNVSISSGVNVADGGVDASILGNTATSSPLLALATRYQLKTGDTTAPWRKSWVHDELFGRGKASAADNLGAGVRRCLDDSGRYVLVCFGIDPTDEQLRTAKDNFVEAFRTCGYPNVNVELWGQTQLLGLFNEFPGLCLRLSGRDRAGFRSYTTWADAADMRQTLRINPDQQQIIEEIRGNLRGNSIGHVRLIGEPGVGKTRLALEATRVDDLAPLVVYVPDGATFLTSNVFLNELIQPDDRQAVILVIDDCLPKDRASIWNLLGAKSDRIRLVTMDHGPDDAGGSRMIAVQVPPTDPKSLAEIISDYGIRKHDAEHWAAYCEGSPRVAHQIGENLRENPGDLLRNPSNVEVWSRFIVGHDDPASENVELRRIVLRHLALFERFGFEMPVDAEARFIADMAAKYDSRLTWPRFQSIIAELKHRRILQGVTTLFTTPRLLQVYLFREFWERHGRGVDLAELLQAMPPQLWLWFVEMLKYAHTSPVAEAAVDRLLGREGLFPDGSFPDEQRQGQLIMALAETNPQPTLRCLQRTIGTMDDTQLGRFRESRQFVVWALERLAVWENCFVGAAELLLKLAETENANHSNNATGTFTELFSIIPGMGATQAAPSRRLPVLRKALNSPSGKARRIGLAACKSALSTHGGFRTVGAEHQGLRKTVEFWMPKTYGELWSAYSDAWGLLTENVSTWSAEDRKDLIQVIIESAWSALHISPLTAEVLATLEQIANDPATDVALLVRFVKRQLRPPGNKLPDDVASRLRALSTRLDGHDFPSKLRRFVKFASFEDKIDESGELTRSIETTLDDLSNEAIADPAALENELSWLVCEDSGQSFGLAFRIGKQDRERKLLKTLFKAQEQLSDQAKPTFVCGYLAAIFDDNKKEWEQTILALSDSRFIRTRFSDFVVGSGMSDSAALKVIQLCQTGEVDPVLLERWWFAPSIQQLSEPVLIELIELQLLDPRHKLWQNAVQMCHSYYLDEPRDLPSELLFRVLTNEGISVERHTDSASYYWSRLAAAFVNRYPDRKWEFFEAVLRSSAKPWANLTDLEMGEGTVMANILKSDPKQAWEIIAKILPQVERRDYSGIRHWLSDGAHHAIGDEQPGPIQYIPASSLFEWIDTDREERASWIAMLLPKTLDQTRAGRLTHDFIARYCSSSNVGSTLYCRFHSRGWCGPASDHHRKLRDEAQTWLIGEQDQTVIRWVEAYIDGLNADIKRAEIDEERRL